MLDGVFSFVYDTENITRFIRMKLSHVYFVVYLWVYLLMFIQKLITSITHSAVQNSGHNYARSSFLVWLYHFDSLSDLLRLKLKFSEKCLGRL